ncbi:MAG: hypothetical protein IKG22_10520 [Atopobiaceae bacterium]|nr:hypothetical protein [Atopobiaceae bacterium]
MRIVRNGERLGEGPSLGRGAEEARGEYLAFVDPRDYVSPHCFELLYAAATADGGHDIAKGLGLHINAAGRSIERPDGGPTARSDGTSLMGGRFTGYSQQGFTRPSSGASSCPPRRARRSSCACADTQTTSYLKRRQSTATPRRKAAPGQGCSRVAPRPASMPYWAPSRSLRATSSTDGRGRIFWTVRMRRYAGTKVRSLPTSRSTTCSKATLRCLSLLARAVSAGCGAPLQSALCSTPYGRRFRSPLSGETRRRANATAR